MGKAGGKKGKAPVCPDYMTPEYFQQSNVRTRRACLARDACDARLRPPLTPVPVGCRCRFSVRRVHEYVALLLSTPDVFLSILTPCRSLHVTIDPQDLPLLVEIAKKPNWKPPVPMTRAQALCHLWTHSLQTPKRKQEIVDQGALQAAVSSCNPSGPMTDRAPGIGLIHSIAMDPELCETVVAARAIAVALDLCRSSSLTAQAAAVGTLCKLAEHQETRKRVIKDIVAYGWTPILDLIRANSSRLEAKSDGARVLAICAKYGEGNQASIDAIRADLGRNTLAMEYLLDHACDSKTVGNAILRESAALFLRCMSEDDDNKNKLATRETLSRIVTVLAGESASLQCKASLCHALFSICTQTKEKAALELGDAGGEDVVEAGEDMDGDCGEVGGVLDPLTGEPAGEGGGERVGELETTVMATDAKPLPVPSSDELERLQMVIEAGGIHPLVVLCAGPGGFAAKPPEDEGKGGKKGKKKGGKKKKEPPVSPEMADAQLAAAGMLRRLTMKPEWAAMAAREEAARLLMPLLNAKQDQTRWHATAALWSMSGDAANNSTLSENKAPEFFTKVVPYKGEKAGVFLTEDPSQRGRPGTASDGGKRSEE